MTHRLSYGSWGAPSNRHSYTHECAEGNGWGGGQHMGAGVGVNMLQVEARFLTSAIEVIEDVADDI